MDPAGLARISSRLKEFVDRGSAAGFVTLVARHGHLANLEATGYQDLEAKTPMRTDTIFRIKSLTKPLTAAGIMILVDEARISLNDPIERYLPEFNAMRLNPCAGNRQASCDPVSPSRLITVRDLLTHTSGLPDSGPRAGTPPASLAEMVSNGARATLISEPGAAWHYSNIGFATLGRLIEVVSRQPYDVFMTERLFRPLGMKDTHYFLPPEKVSRLAVLYTESGGKLVRASSGPESAPASKIPGPEGGLYSTALDQARFYQMLIDKGALNGRRILSAAAAGAMTTNQTGDMKNVEFSPGLGMGFGFGVVKDAIGTFRYQSIGSFMKGGAYRTFAWGDPARDLIGVIMYQRTNGGGDIAPETNAFVTLAEAAVLP